MKCTKCQAEIALDEIEYYNGCNEEREDYAVVQYTCSCGEEYEFNQWGEVDNMDEAVIWFTDEFTERFGL